MTYIIRVIAELRPGHYNVFSDNKPILQYSRNEYLVEGLPGSMFSIEKSKIGTILIDGYNHQWQDHIIYLLNPTEEEVEIAKHDVHLSAWKHVTRFENEIQRTKALLSNASYVHERVRHEHIDHNHQTQITQLGKFLEALRGRMSLREAAAKSGLSHAYIRDLELAKNRTTDTVIAPSTDTLRKLALAYNHPYHDILRRAGYLGY